MISINQECFSSWASDISLDRVTNFSEMEGEISELLCKICNQILVEPKDCRFCQATFCTSCILYKFKVTRKKHCPNCKQEKWRIGQNKFIQLLLNKLELRCNYKKNGCNEILKYDQLRLHEEQQCQFRNEMEFKKKKKPPSFFCNSLLTKFRLSGKYHLTMLNISKEIQHSIIGNFYERKNEILQRKLDKLSNKTNKLQKEFETEEVLTQLSKPIGQEFQFQKKEALFKKGRKGLNYVNGWLKFFHTELQEKKLLKN